MNAARTENRGEIFAAATIADAIQVIREASEANRAYAPTG